MKDFLLFISNFIRNPKDTGAVVPSSRFLTKKMMEHIDFKAAENIVELGPGLGAFTKAILEKSKEDAEIFCFEINKKFCSHLRKKFDDSRLHIINKSAEKISSHLKDIGIKKADYVVSGLPFLDFSDSKRRIIINEVKNLIDGKGKFILFQYTTSIEKLLKANFSKVERKFVPMNLPPAFIYILEN